MSGIEEVLGRLIGDEDFRDQIQAAPRHALAGYELTAEDLELISSVIEEAARLRCADGPGSHPPSLLSLLRQPDATSESGRPSDPDTGATEVRPGAVRDTRPAG